MCTSKHAPPENDAQGAQSPPAEGTDLFLVTLAPKPRTLPMDLTLPRYSSSRRPSIHFSTSSRRCSSRRSYLTVTRAWRFCSPPGLPPGPRARDGDCSLLSTRLPSRCAAIARRAPCAVRSRLAPAASYGPGRGGAGGGARACGGGGRPLPDTRPQFPRLQRQAPVRAPPAGFRGGPQPGGLPNKHSGGRGPGTGLPAPSGGRGGRCRSPLLPL